MGVSFKIQHETLERCPRPGGRELLPGGVGRGFWGESEPRQRR